MRQILLMTMLAAGMLLAGCSKDSDATQDNEKRIPSPFVNMTYWLDMRTSDWVNWHFVGPQFLYLNDDGTFAYYIDTVTNADGVREIKEEGTYKKYDNELVFFPSEISNTIKTASIEGDTIFVKTESNGKIRYVKGVDMRLVKPDFNR